MDYSQLRKLTAREMISALIRDGFGFDRGAGSHQVYYHPDGRRLITAKTPPASEYHYERGTGACSRCL